MDLIERYISAVGSRIWGKNRKDIESELRSILLDTLDEKTSGREASEKDAAEMLKEFGHPSKVAARYNLDRKYIIGPELYDLYILIVKIVSVAAPAGLIIGKTVELMKMNQADINMLWQIFLLIPGCLMTLISAVGFITIVFAVIERTAVLKNGELNLLINKDWDPYKLPETVRKHDEIKRYSKIINILWIILILIIINFFSGKIGVYYGTGSGGLWKFIPVFNDSVLDKFIPVWSILLVVRLVLNAILIKDGSWNKKTRIFNMLIMIADIIVFAMLISTPDFLSINAAIQNYSDMGKEMISVLYIIEKFFKYGLILIFIPMFIEVGKEIFILARSWQAD